MEIELMMQVAPRLVLLYADAEDSTSLDRMVYFCNSTVIHLMEREISELTIKEDITPEDLKDVLDKICSNVTINLNKIFSDEKMDLIAGEITATSVSNYIVSLRPTEMALHKAPSSTLH